MHWRLTYAVRLLCYSPPRLPHLSAFVLLCLSYCSLAHSHKPAIVGYCDLSGDNLEEMLTRHKSASNRVRGIRQMLNYHPDVPEQCQATHDDYLTDPNWIQGYGLLENFQMSFDLQVFPWQMKRSAFFVVVVCCAAPALRCFIYWFWIMSFLFSPLALFSLALSNLVSIQSWCSIKLLIVCTLFALSFEFSLPFRFLLECNSVKIESSYVFALSTLDIGSDNATLNSQCLM